VTAATTSLAAALAGLVTLGGSADAARAQERECTDCHASTTHAWRASFHARAAVDPLYVAEHERRRDPWCDTCHDPRGAARGVDCVVCHVRDGAVVSTTARGTAPHATVVDPAMGTTAACARCHDFDFPHVAGQPMQDTVDEWRASAPGARGEPCQQCHMAPVGAGHDHTLAGWRDPTLLARALDVQPRAWIAGGTTRVELVLTSRAGHAVPTGDLYRRLVVSAEADGVRRAATLRRRFDERDGQLHELGDDRVAARGSRRVVLVLPARADRVRWSIELWAVAERRADELDLPDEAWRAPVAEGELAVVSGPERRVQR